MKLQLFKIIDIDTPSKSYSALLKCNILHKVNINNTSVTYILALSQLIIRNSYVTFDTLSECSNSNRQRDFREYNI